MMSQTIGKYSNKFVGVELQNAVECEDGGKKREKERNVRPSCAPSWSLHLAQGGPTWCCGGDS
jgi:hypothetical protein